MVGFRKADKAIKTVLYFLKLCKLKENFSPSGAKCNQILRYSSFQEFLTFVPKTNLDEAARENGVFIPSGINFPSQPLLARSYLVCSHLETLLANCVIVKQSY